MGYLTGSLTADQAVTELQNAIDLGDLTSQHALAGHPIFAAVDTARTVLAFVQENAEIIGPALSPGSRTWTQIDNALEGIYQAAATVTNDPAAPLPRMAVGPIAPAMPWGWIAAGGAALLAIGYLSRKGRF